MSLSAFAWGRTHAMQALTNAVTAPSTAASGVFINCATKTTPNGDNLHDISNPLFWGIKNKKTFSKCCLLKILPGVTSINEREGQGRKRD